MIGLSKRLQTICDMVRPGTRICDVGCDHAYVDIRLLQENKIAFALAMDVADGPLATARSNLELTELYESGRCELRKSDGLAAYEPGEADCMVCAGMGGILMASLLESEAKKAASFDELLLSPQSEIHLVREWLRRSDFIIAEERFLKDEGKYYTVIRAVPRGQYRRRPENECSVQKAACENKVLPEGTADGSKTCSYENDPKGGQPRPDWERIAEGIRMLPGEITGQAGVDAQTLCKMLCSPTFQSLAEKTYGPCILKLYLEGSRAAGEASYMDAAAQEESASCFEQFLAETIRGRLAIAAELNQKLEDLGTQRGQNLMQRLQDIQTQIGVLQTLLAARTLSAFRLDSTASLESDMKSRHVR